MRSRLVAATAAVGGCLLPTAAALAQPAAVPAQRPRYNPFGDAEKTFTATCSGCHGSDLSGGRGPSLFNPALLAARSDETLRDTIQNGMGGGEMPPFKGVLSDELKPKPAFVPDPTNKIIHSQKQTFRIEVVASGLETPWGLAFLPDGRLLVTERPGRLRIIDAHGHLLPTPVAGTPKVWERQDSGLLDVAVHPQYRRNGWIYLSYTEVAPGHVMTPEEINPKPGVYPQPSPPSMTVLIRGRIDARGQWVDTQQIFRAPTSLYTASGAHYGSRFLFDGKGHLFFSLGERGDMANAQRLDTPLGKIHRVNDDGSVPADNPFVRRPGAVGSIWSYGHRNPQGLAFDPVTGLLWEAEHGPTGGDEINIIEKGHNYGWGVVSMGIQPGITARSAPGMDPPIAFYTPTIAPSGIGFNSGSRYPRWKDNLFVAALAGQQLRRLEIRGREIVSQEVLFEQFGRTRAVTMGPDGLLYVLLQNPTGSGTGVSLAASTPGMVVRLVPIEDGK